MNDEPQFSNLIYEYFIVRFHFQYYQYGDLLPSVDTLCQKFSVSAQTVKAALRRLRSEGYITMQSGQITKVIFKTCEKGLSKEILQYFSNRWDTFSDLYTTTEVVLLPLLMEGMRRLNSEDFTYLAHIARHANTDDLFQFYSYILQKIENPLTLNLFWEISLFLGFPFAGLEQNFVQYDAASLRIRLTSLLSFARAQNWTALQNSIVACQRQDINQALAYLRRLILPQPKELQTPFIWRIYRDRPQLCYNLAIRILHEIYLGEYRSARRLPSYQKMAKQYNVSVSTMRRTIQILTYAGAVQPINGVGIRIFSADEPCNPPDLTKPAIRRNLALFFQSFEIIIYSCEAITDQLLNALTQEQRKSLISLLETNLSQHHCEFSIWNMLIWIAQYSPLQGVREVYGKIYGLFLWGYPLRASQSNLTKVNQMAKPFTETLLYHLKRGDYLGCAAAMRKLLTLQFAAAENFLLQQGLRPEELRLSPSIRFLLSDSE